MNPDARSHDFHIISGFMLATDKPQEMLGKGEEGSFSMRSRSHTILSNFLLLTSYN